MKLDNLVSLLLLLVLVIFIATGAVTEPKVDVSYDSFDLVEHLTTHELHVVEESTYPEELVNFMTALAFRESSGVIDTVSVNGMLGKYQFSPRTLRGLGFSGEVDSFLQNEHVQDSLFVELLKFNTSILKPVINYHTNRIVENVTITPSGILAAAHLMGPGGVIAFLNPGKYDYDVSDMHGTHLIEYMELFGNYNIMEYIE